MKRGFFNRRKSGRADEDGHRLKRAALTEADGIITPNEATDRHGIGIIVERFFGEFPNTLSVRSQDSFGGEQNFGTEKLRISHLGLARWESYERMLRLLNGSTVRRILCIPFFPDDLITAICLKEIFNAPLCIYVMDDNNIGAHGIPDHLFAEALAKARLRLGISPEIRDAYQAKFGELFHVLPPLVESRWLSELPPAKNFPFQTDTAVLIGNVWSQKWLERLRLALRGSGLKVHWYGNTGAKWLNYSSEDLARDGISSFGFIPENELVARLRSYPFALIPSGSLDQNDDRPELARLSLPSRIPYLAGVAHLPLIVLGSPETAAGNFVRHFDVGIVCSYSPEALRGAAAEICKADCQARFRRKAAALGPAFTLENAGQWIWDSLANGAPLDDRFERIMPRR